MHQIYDRGYKKLFSNKEKKEAHDKAVSIANQLFKMNLSVTEIAKITGLTLEVLEQLRSHQ